MTRPEYNIPEAEQLTPNQRLCEAGSAAVQLLGGLVIGAVSGAVKGAISGAQTGVYTVRSRWHERANQIAKIESYANDPEQHKFPAE